MGVVETRAALPGSSQPLGHIQTSHPSSMQDIIFVYKDCIIAHKLSYFYEVH